MDWPGLIDALAPLETLAVTSATQEKAVYLRRPDLGRVLAPGEAQRLPACRYGIVFVIGDGLSAAAANA